MHHSARRDEENKINEMFAMVITIGKIVVKKVNVGEAG